MTLAFDVGGCSVLVEPSDQGRKPQPVTAHNRHYVRSLATLNSAHKCRYVAVGVKETQPEQKPPWWLVASQNAGLSDKQTPDLGGRQ